MGPHIAMGRTVPQGSRNQGRGGQGENAKSCLEGEGRVKCEISHLKLLDLEVLLLASAINKKLCRSKDFESIF